MMLFYLRMTSTRRKSKKIFCIPRQTALEHQQQQIHIYRNIAYIIYQIKNQIMVKLLSLAAVTAIISSANVVAFTAQPATAAFLAQKGMTTRATTPLQMSSFDDDFLQETPAMAQQRIQDLVDENPVLLFMKGSKIFPQCGFSSTAAQILNTFGIEYQTG